MATDEQKTRAEERFERALAESGARDPREFYRERLRALRDADEAAFRSAREYYEERLVPAVAADESDPLQEWIEYGRVLATLAAAGRTVQIDPGGRAHPYARPVPVNHLVLHLPDSPRLAAITVGLPPILSPAQRATYELLVAGRRG